MEDYQAVIRPTLIDERVDLCTCMINVTPVIKTPILISSCHYQLRLIL